MGVSVFISWSNAKSRACAEAMNEWLSSVVQSAEIFVSSQDIQLGKRWSPEIAQKLENCGFGILCLTKENLEAPWILFEAGALSKIVSQSNVVPIALDFPIAEIRAPLNQFQAATVDKGDMLDLVRQINELADSPLPEGRLLAIFEKWWPDLAERLEEAKKTDVKQVKASKGNLDADVILASLGDIVKSVQQTNSILSSPTRLLPPEYFSDMLSRIDRQSPRTRSAMRSAMEKARELYIKYNNGEREGLETSIMEIVQAIDIVYERQMIGSYYATRRIRTDDTGLKTA